MALMDLDPKPGTVAGRVRYENGRHYMFGTLFREKVRHFFM
jgi:hypothetical protein